MNKYIWNENENDEYWYHDQFETIEECIEDAIVNYDLRPGDVIYVGETYPWNPTPDVANMLEDMEIDAYEECGECAENWDITPTKKNMEAYIELCDRINLALNEYLKKIGEVPKFFKIENIHQIVISEDDWKTIDK